MFDKQVFVLRHRGVEKVQAFGNAEGVAFGGVVTDGNNETIKEGEALFDHPEVAIGVGIEGPCVDGGSHGRSNTQIKEEKQTIFS